MPKIRLTVLSVLFSVSTALAAKSVMVMSPDKNIVFRLSANENGLTYRVTYKGNVLIDNSRLSISFKQGGEFGHDVSLGKPAYKKIEEEYDLAVRTSSPIRILCNEAMV